MDDNDKKKPTIFLATVIALIGSALFLLGLVVTGTTTARMQVKPR
jgi:hypothetical protein